MGLDTTHDAWHGAYSSFMEWRVWLANQIGLNLYEMEGFSDRDYSNPNRKLGAIKWDTVDDDLKYLLNHSDCDGYLTPTQCKKIASRLTDLLEGKSIPESYTLADDDGYFLSKTKKFRDGCLKAFKDKQRLEFH